MDDPFAWSSEELIEKVNTRINSRVVYGYYRVTARAPSSIIAWSNHDEYWFIHKGMPRLKKGESREIDANHILVPGRLRDIKEILPYLDPLPLHSGGPRGGSDEYKVGIEEWRIPSD